MVLLTVAAWYKHISITHDILSNETLPCWQVTPWINIHIFIFIVSHDYANHFKWQSTIIANCSEDTAFFHKLFWIVKVHSMNSRTLFIYSNPPCEKYLSEWDMAYWWSVRTTKLHIKVLLSYNSHKSFMIIHLWFYSRMLH